MSGILLYTSFEAKRNAFAVEKFKKYTDVKLCDENYRGSADFVINRTNDYKIAEFYENQQIRVFNSSSFSHLANDKQKAYDFMEKNGVNIMETRYNLLPVVVKPRNGKGGQGVRLITQRELPIDDNLVYQKPANNLGRDLRVFVIGGEIITSILRTSKTDFRSNFCLGGSATPYQLSSEEKEKIMKIISLVNGDYYGIDLVFNDEKIVFNELEDSVGARMVYKETDIDIIKLYCNYINSVL